MSKQILSLYYDNFSLRIPVEFLYGGPQVTSEEYDEIKDRFQDHVAHHMGAAFALLVEDD